MQCGYERVAGSGFADVRQSEKVRRRKVLIALLVMQASSERRDSEILIVVPLETSGSPRIGVGSCMLQKHEARERRYRDQNWEEITSI